MRNKKTEGWEMVYENEDDDDSLLRVAVPGGWIYRSVTHHGDDGGLWDNVVFVPLGFFRRVIRRINGAW